MTEAVTLGPYDTDAGLMAQAMACAGRGRKRAIGAPVLLAVIFAVSLVAGQVIGAVAPGLGAWLPAFLVGIAAGLGIAALYFMVQRNRVLARSLAVTRRQGPVTAVLDASGIRFSHSLGDRRHAWEAFDGMEDIPGGLCLVSGGLAYPLPRHALPEGMTLADLRARIAAWSGLS
ncbi:YcxB family protein [Pseudaestuariivita atlantica]|uniref:YcxB-like protein domain-containing protein n=1 Tax=Pseudaestuariivita atlantica TaxID=1317121 RepID=A0A0L1JLI4_9RHOB|nr:YcxB family protein [Pseudaestuariivita atlantica]KNG92577.1 hypothetical protein ATO11_16255 [Pseudaestuariivita atlantica]